MQNNDIWNVILEHLKGRVFKLALKKILGSAYAGGFKAWLVQFLIENLWDEIVNPLLNAGLVEIKYIKDKVEGRITADKIDKARKSGDQTNYDIAVDDVYK